MRKFILLPALLSLFSHDAKADWQEAQFIALRNAFQGAIAPAHQVEMGLPTRNAVLSSLAEDERASAQIFFQVACTSSQIATAADGSVTYLNPPRANFMVDPETTSYFFGFSPRSGRLVSFMTPHRTGREFGVRAIEGTMALTFTSSFQENIGWVAPHEVDDGTAAIVFRVTPRHDWIAEVVSEVNTPVYPHLFPAISGSPVYAFRYIHCLNDFRPTARPQGRSGGSFIRNEMVSN